MQFMRSLKLII